MVLRGRSAFLQEQLEAQRAANHELAALISFAVHSPKDMPRYRTMAELSKPADQRTPTEADHARIRAHLMALVEAGKEKNGAKRNRGAPS